MLKLDHAQRIADVFLEALSESGSKQLMFAREPVEFANGWLFVYNDQRYIETGDISYALGGNGPIAVFAAGRVEILGTSKSVKTLVEHLNAVASVEA